MAFKSKFTIGLGGRISQIRKKTTRFSSSLNALFPPANVNHNTIPRKKIKRSKAGEKFNG
jgi:hypothetical protein